MSWRAFWSRLLASILTCSLTGHSAPPPSCLPAAGCGPSVKPGSLLASADPAPQPRQVPLLGCPYRLPDSARGLHQFLGSHHPHLPVTTCQPPALTAPCTQTVGLCEHPLSGTETLPARVSTLLETGTSFHRTPAIMPLPQRPLFLRLFPQKMHWVQFYTLRYGGPPRRTSSRCSLGSGGGGVKNQ